MTGRPSDISPTDVYNHEYDGFADSPKYPINFLPDIDANLGIVFNHIAYLGLTPDQIANAVHLETSGPDSLTNCYMIESPRSADEHTVMGFLPDQSGLDQVPDALWQVQGQG